MYNVFLEMRYLRGDPQVGKLNTSNDNIMTLKIRRTRHTATRCAHILYYYNIIIDIDGVFRVVIYV